MIVLVFGGRTYGVPPSDPHDVTLRLERQRERELLMEALSILHEEHRITKVVSGMAKGADTIAIQWAREMDVDYSVYPADWQTYGSSAGPRRNQQMLDEEAIDAGLEAKGGNGTKDMHQRLVRAGIEIFSVDSLTETT